MLFDCEQLLEAGILANRVPHRIVPVVLIALGIYILSN